MNSTDLMFLILHLGLCSGALHLASGKPLTSCALSTLMLFFLGLTLGILGGDAL